MPPHPPRRRGQGLGFSRFPSRTQGRRYEKAVADFAHALAPFGGTVEWQGILAPLELGGRWLHSAAMNVKRVGVAALPALGLALALAGCSGANVSVRTTVPTPLVEPVPLSVGVHFDASLAHYVHEEELDTYGKFRIELGATQVPVFERVFDALFAHTQRVESVAAAAPAVEAIIVPAVEELQFSIPEQTRSDFFEVWIKYKIDVYHPDGELLVSWPLPAYGKSNSRNFGFMEGGQTPGLSEAAVRALRDAAAHAAFYLPTAPEIQALMAARKGASSQGAPRPGALRERASG